jgi:hypothetical protein
VTAAARGAFALAAWMATAGVARGASAAPLDLSVSGCTQLDEGRLRALVAIEMATVGADGAKALARVRLACAGERVTIDVADNGPSPSSRSELDLSSTPEATRLRLLALTITELVSLSWSAPPVSPAPASRDRGSAVAVRAAAPPDERRWSLFGGTSVRRMGRPGTWLTGLGVGVARSVGDFVALAFELRGETGEAAVSVAAVDWRQLVLTGALAVGVTGERWAFHALPGWSMGVVQLSASPTATDARGGTLDGTWSGPSLGLRGRRALGGAGFVALDASGGFVTRRIVGLLDGQTSIFEVRGAWALVGLSAGVAF